MAGRQRNTRTTLHLTAATRGERISANEKLADLFLHLDALGLTITSMTLEPGGRLAITFAGNTDRLDSQQMEHLGLEEAT